jgi:hypothetical protein
VRDLARVQHLEPAPDVEGDDGGHGVLDVAQHRGDLVCRAVVQQPAQQR